MAIGSAPLRKRTGQRPRSDSQRRQQSPGAPRVLTSTMSALQANSLVRKRACSGESATVTAQLPRQGYSKSWTSGSARSADATTTARRFLEVRSMTATLWAKTQAQPDLREVRVSRRNEKQRDGLAGNRPLSPRAAAAIRTRGKDCMKGAIRLEGTECAR